MNEPANITALAGLLPDYMGFIFYAGSPRVARMEELESVLNGLPSGIQKVGVFVNEEQDRVIEHAERLHLDLIQLHGDETDEYCRALGEEGIRIIKAFRISDEFSFDHISVCDFVENFLFDTSSERYGGSGNVFAWDKLKDYHQETPYFLSGGIGLDAQERLLGLDLQRLPYAVDINSKFEIRPGLKDVNLVSQFIRLLRHEIHN